MSRAPRPHQAGPSTLADGIAREGDVMHVDMPACVPDDQVSNLAWTMTEKRYPHLPVVVDGVLCGIVSLGDVVKSRVDHVMPLPG